MKAEYTECRGSRESSRRPSRRFRWLVKSVLSSSVMVSWLVKVIAASLSQTFEWSCRRSPISRRRPTLLPNWQKPDVTRHNGVGWYLVPRTAEPVTLIGRAGTIQVGTVGVPPRIHPCPRPVRTCSSRSGCYDRAWRLTPRAAHTQQNLSVMIQTCHHKNSCQPTRPIRTLPSHKPLIA